MLYYTSAISEQEISELEQRLRRKTMGLMRKKKKKQQQLLCSCVLNFGTFLYPPMQNSNMKLPNSRFCGKSEHMTVNFSFSFLTRTRRQPNWFLGSLPSLYKLNEGIKIIIIIGPHINEVNNLAQHASF